MKVCDLTRKYISEYKKHIQKDDAPVTNRLTFLPFKEAIPLIKTGDVLLWRGTSWISWIISGYTDSEYTHVAIVNRDDENDILEAVQFREFKGGLSSNLKIDVKNSPRKIDVFRPSEKFPFFVAEKGDDGRRKFLVRWKKFNGALPVKLLKYHTGKNYGYNRILLLAVRRICFLRFLVRFFPEKANDPNAHLSCPVCSTAVEHVFNKSGYVLIERKNPNLVTPGDIATSPHLHYRFYARSVK